MSNRSTFDENRKRRSLWMPMALIIAVIIAGGLPRPAAHAQCDPQQILKMLPSEASYQAAFGYRLAISGTTAVIGAGSDSASGAQSGSAFLFDLVTGTELAKLVPDDSAQGDYFGYAAAICGTTAIVGAYGDDDNGSSSGSAYLFDSATGTQLAKLLPDDGSGGAYFGYAVAINDTIALVAAPRAVEWEHLGGAVYVFDLATGAQVGKFWPEDDAYDDYFGYAVAMDGTTAIVGTPYDGDNGAYSGSAYLFDITTGTQLAKLLPGDGAEYDQFGISVAISGGSAVVGSWMDGDNGIQSGSAYLFDTATGAQIAKLLPGDGAAEDVFGCAVAIGGTSAIVGAFGDDARTGAAYLFDRVSGTETAKIVADDGGALDSFGSAVAMTGNIAVIGAYLDDDNYSSGSAYLFDTNCPEPLTIGVEYHCLPASGTLPFSTQMDASLHNFYSGLSRRVAARVDVTLANGQFFSNWKAGFANIAAGGSFSSSWSATIPQTGSMLGDNTFLLVAEDVTPAPFNQPPHPPAGDSDQASCTVTGFAP
jgi:hypothetical protein